MDIFVVLLVAAVVGVVVWGLWRYFSPAKTQATYSVTDRNVARSLDRNHARGPRTSHEEDDGIGIEDVVVAAAMINALTPADEGYERSLVIPDHLEHEGHGQVAGESYPEPEELDRVAQTYISEPSTPSYEPSYDSGGSDFGGSDD